MVAGQQRRRKGQQLKWNINGCHHLLDCVDIIKVANEVNIVGVDYGLGQPRPPFLSRFVEYVKRRGPVVHCRRRFLLGSPSRST